MTSLAVKVAVKVRPLNKRENSHHEKECTIIEPAAGNLKTIKLGPDGKLFTYDYVVDYTERASDFYEDSVSCLVNGLFEGYNATVLAYGQTGSGKTYTMGTSGKMSETEEENLGVVPRAARQIFQMVDALKQKYNGKQHQPEITVGTKFLELYQDKLVDLYDYKNPIQPKIIQDQANGIQVKSIVKEVNSAEEIIEVLQEGAQNRQVGGTNMNAESSRSHAVFVIDIKLDLPDIESADEEQPEMKKLTAKFCLVDLAGSERLGKTGAEGGRKQEGIAINQGLLSLGNVISALGNPRKKAHVNYRDTKLTFLLKDSLGGNSKTLMIACISPSAGEVNETKNTLEYANRARSIKNTVKKNQDETSLLLTELKEHIAELEAAIQRCTCGNATISKQLKPEVEEEQEALPDSVEKTPVLSQQRQISTTSLLNYNRTSFSSLDDEVLRFSQPPPPLPPPSTSTIFTDEQSLIAQQKNEDLEARVNSLQIVNTHISHELAELKTKMALLKISYKACDEKEMNEMMTQQLHDYKLKNEELEMEMSCRKKYYSLLDEYRREREKFSQPLTKQNNERMAQDILTLAEEDVIRRKEFYDTLPETVLKPKKRKRKRRAMYRLLPKQLSSCLFDLADYENASKEVLDTVLEAETIYSSHRAADLNEGKERIIYENELQVILEEREKNKQRLAQLELGFNEQYRLENSLIIERAEAKEDSRKESEANSSIEQQEPTLYTEEDYANASVEVLAMMRREETEFTKERARKRLKEKEDSRKESEANSSIEQQESTLYTEEDYANASVEVLAMMRREETEFTKERARKRLKEKEDSRKESEANASIEQQEPTLYTAEDYANASVEVLAMMRREETEFTKERARKRLKEKEDSRKESEANASIEQQEPTLYTAEDYANASVEVLAMMRREETEFTRERARKRLKEKEDSRKESEANASIEQQESTLYTTEDYANASVEVLAMMRREETEFTKERARKRLKENEDSRKESEANASIEQQESTLYTAEDYANASVEVLAMMRREETEFTKERARKRLKEKEDSRKESEANSSIEQQEPTLYTAEDYANASVEVLAMMRREETEFTKERARKRLKEKEDSRKESEANSSIEQQEPTLYTAEDYANASVEVLAMMRREETEFTRERARKRLKEKEDSRKESEANSSIEQQEPTLYTTEDYANASVEVLAMMRREETEFTKERARKRLKEKEDSRKESEANASIEQQEPTLYTTEDYANASVEVLAMMRREETEFTRERARKRLKEKEDSRKESEANASIEQQEPTLYTEEDYANASVEVLAMMRREETEFTRERARKRLKEKEDSRKESEANASIEQQEPTLYTTEDYANASVEVLAMMRREETEFTRERARKRLKEKEDSRKESEANASIEQQELLVHDLSTFVDTPDEIFRNSGVLITRSKARVSLRDLKILCNDSEPSQSEVIQESSLNSHTEPDPEDVLTSMQGVEEQQIGNVSQQDNSFPANLDILNDTQREDSFNSERIPVIINSSLLPTAEQRWNVGDLISSLPEEDQAIHLMENIDDVTVPPPPPDPPTEIVSSEPSNPYYLKYLDFSSDTNSDSNEYQHTGEVDELNPNSSILNPDVYILLEDINLRKNLIHELKQERVRHSSMNKQSRDRIRELALKINKLEDLRDQLNIELKESKNAVKIQKIPKKNLDEKKASILTKELAEERKKFTSLNKELNEEKKKSKQLEKELTQTQGTENWKVAFENSERKRKELEANLRVSQKKVDTMVKDQANKIKGFEKKAEFHMSVEKSKTKEVIKCNAENTKLNKEFTESKKKIVNLGEKNSKLQSLLTETKAKLTKSKPIPLNNTPTTKKSALKTSDNSGKLDDKKNVPSRTPSVRESKEQEAKDSVKSLELVEKLINSNLNKPAILQHIKALVEKRVNSQLDRYRKSVIKKVPAMELNRKDRSVDKSFQKDDKSIELRGLKFDAKKVAGSDLPEDVVSFVSGLNEKRCKRTLEAMFLYSLYEGVRKRVRVLEEERLSSTNNELAERVSRMENIMTFVKDELVVVDTRTENTDNPSLNHSYSTSDLTRLKLNRPSPVEQITIKVPSSDNIRTASPYLNSSSKHNISRSNLSARSGYPSVLSSNSNSNSTSNLRSSSPAKSVSSSPLPNKSIIASSTGSLCPNKQASLNKSPAKHPPLIRTKTQLTTPQTRDPVKKAASVSTPLSPQAKTFSLGQSADDTNISPTTRAPFLLQTSYPPRSNSNKKSNPNNTLPVCKRAITIPLKQTNSPVILQPATRSISVMSPTPSSNTTTPLSSQLGKPIGTQTKPKQQLPEPNPSFKHSPTKGITHIQETQTTTLQKYKPPSKTPRKLDILKSNTTYSVDQKLSILTLQLGEDSLITATSDRKIRCLDLETLKEKFSSAPMQLTETVRKLEYRMSDRLLYVSSGKKIKIFDLRTQKPVFEIKGFCGDKFTISDMVTTMDPNIIYLACGPEVLVWELTSNKLYGKLVENSSNIVTMCYGVRRGKYPILAICCKDQTVKIYDYPEANWSRSSDGPTNSSSSSSLNQIPSPKPHTLYTKSFSFPENEYTPLFPGFISKPPTCPVSLAYLNNSSLVHYEDVLLLSNNADILQYHLDEKRKINTVGSATDKSNGKNLSDLNNMVRFPNQPLIVTTCRKGSINFWNPITLKTFSKQNCFANTQFLYDSKHVVMLSCNSRMIATTNNKKQNVVKLWNVDVDFLNTP